MINTYEISCIKTNLSKTIKSKDYSREDIDKIIEFYRKNKNFKISGF